MLSITSGSLANHHQEPAGHREEEDGFIKLPWRVSMEPPSLWARLVPPALHCPLVWLATGSQFFSQGQCFPAHQPFPALVYEAEAVVMG